MAECIVASAPAARTKLREMRAAIRKAVPKYSTGKGSVQFPLDKLLPLALIRKITAYRVRESAVEDRKRRASGLGAGQVELFARRVPIDP